MVFSSQIFLFVFLPITFLLLFVFRNIKAQNVILLAMSLLFYAWGEPVYIFLMLATVLLNYFLTFAFNSENQGRRKLALIASIVVNIGFLVVYKYSAFLVENVNQILNTEIPVPEIVLPIGISFFTFQMMSYVVDVYRRDVAIQRSYYKLLLYIMFFPQIIAGPIVKYHDINEQIDDRDMNVEKVAKGINRFIVGLAKKILIANAVGEAVDAIYSLPSNEITTPLAWFAAIGYCIQLYFDFSGYSDMAIGLAQMAGFELKENFNYPFISRSIKDFWRRWHISLSTWFKEYVYIPLGGNRKGKHRTAFNLMVVFALTGIWHGASWTFIIWGLFHGFLIVLEGYKIINVENWRFRFFQHLYALTAVVIGFVFFRADDLELSMTMLSTMFFNFNWDMTYFLEIVDKTVVIAFVAGIICATPILPWIKTKLKFGQMQIGFACSLVLFTMCLLFLSANSYNPFIYFRF